MMRKKKISVLIVDDNKKFVGRMLSLLGEVDHIDTIYTAFNCDEASLLLDTNPDLVLLDIKMPGKNGISFLKQLRDQDAKSEVIMLTNTVGDYYRQQCKNLGALHFLDKTNEFERVPDMIREFATAQ